MIHIETISVDKDRNLIIGESGVYESFTDDRGKLFRQLVKEHGRCTGRVYIDKVAGPDAGKTVAVGWVFLKRVKYDDCDKTFLCETWVSLLERPDEVTRTRHYLEIPA